jgi:hypothetical protein
MALKLLFMSKIIVRKYESEHVGQAVFALVGVQEAETVIERQSLERVLEESRYTLEFNGTLC